MNDREQQLYETKRRAQLEKWQAEVDKLKAQAAEASADARIELNQQLDELQEQVSHVENLLTELAETGEATWDEARERVESAWHALETGAREAAAELTGSGQA